MSTCFCKSDDSTTVSFYSGNIVNNTTNWCPFWHNDFFILETTISHKFATFWGFDMIFTGLVSSVALAIYSKGNEIWPGNATITDWRSTHGSPRKRHRQQKATNAIKVKQ